MIPLTLLECTLESEYPLDLGANPGSSLRGALYEALAAMYDTGDAVQNRDDLETNPVGWLLRLEDAGTTGGRDVPRPLGLRPPLHTGNRTLTFGLAFYGRGQTVMPMVLSALAAAGAPGIGIGRGRGRGAGRFQLSTVHALDPLTHQPTSVISGGRVVGEIPPPPAPAAYERFAALLDPEILTVNFLAPTRIIVQERLSHEPVFRVWVQRLLERIRLLSELYADPIWIPFEELLPLLDQVQLVHDGTRWQEGWSHSRREGRGKPTGGFIGTATYAGPLQRLLPYLLVGQSVQVGKNIIKGSGWFELMYRWQIT